jgi:DNA topoisomerase-1
MTKSLVIVESPTKAKTIKKYLGKEFEVEATMGHIKDLPKSKLGIDIENDFNADYHVMPNKKEVVKKLKKLAKAASHIYLASDPDREGEAIAWHVAEELEDKKKTTQRITFHEITKQAIEEAIKHPKQLDANLYNAQMARRSMDRIVGYTMSPLLWNRVKRGLSAGRVQSVAVKLICDRQDEIEKFIPQEYWSVEAKLATQDGNEFIAKVVDPKEILNEASALSIKEKIETAASIEISEIKKKTKNRNPYAPFITSTLQQEASKKLRFSAKKTMVIAQQLYEGINLGERGPTGLITYMRTDSPNVSAEAIGKARSLIFAMGKEYLPDSPRIYKAKKSAQEAHEAIRPTGIEDTPESIKNHLTKDQFLLYDLIWKRFIASQMMPAVFDQTSVEIMAGNIHLRWTGSVLRFDGFLRVYITESDDDEESEEKGLPLGDLKTGQKLNLRGIDPKQHFTQPPPRYTEASLIKELEEKGIGRPSTYAPTISTIQTRGYVKLESGAFSPTELGRDVNSLLVAHYPRILDVHFTAKMEDGLDLVEEGKKDYLDTMKSFYHTFSKEHQVAEEEMKNLKREMRPSGIMCEKCGKDMIIRLGKSGHFLGCSGWPECANTKNFTRDASGKIVVKEPVPLDINPEESVCENCGAPMVIKEGRFGQFLACSKYPECKTTARIKQQPQPTDKICEKCGSPVVLRRGRFGPFLACSNYPKCKTILPMTTGIKCPMPGCKGELVAKKTKARKTFYSCSNKECDFVSWTKPVEQKCPKCEATFLLRKGDKLHCPNPACDHEEESAA